MTDQQNTGSDEGTQDTQPEAAAELELPPELIEAAPPALSEVVHVRLGGQAGVRVQEQGPIAYKRVSASAVDQQNDYRQVPIAVLAEVRSILDGEKQLTPGEARASVRDLLTPWLGE